jgi:UDP-glucose 4-epimerase
MKHWLVTGGSGYIGSQLLFELEQSGIDCVNLDVEESSLNRRKMTHVKHIIGDSRDAKILDRYMKNAKGVIHLAGYKYAAKSVTEPGEAFEANFVSTLRVLESMKKNLVNNIVFASSCSLYGSSQEKKVNEYSEIKLESPYSQSKYYSEKMIETYATATSSGFALNHTSLRFFNVAGVGSSKTQDNSPHNLFPILQRKLVTGNSLDVFGNEFNTQDGTAIRDYVYIEEVTKAIRIVMERMSQGKRMSSILNLGSGIETSVLQVIKAFNSQLSRPIKYSIQPPRIGDPSRVVADVSRAGNELHWFPKISLEEIVKTILAEVPLEGQ